VIVARQEMPVTVEQEVPLVLLVIQEALEAPDLLDLKDVLELQGLMGPMVILA